MQKRSGRSCITDEDHMEPKPQVVFWQRLDIPGLERLTLKVADDVLTAVSTVICLEDGGFRLDYRWTLSRDWRTRSVEVEKWGAGEHRRLMLERAGSGWKVDGMRRMDLDEADEPDLSVTPFCNTLPVQHMMREKLAVLTLETCYIDAASMRVARSRQKYERVTANLARYIDLGLSIGFEADLEVDDTGLVVSYEKLFERIAPR